MKTEYVVTYELAFFPDAESEEEATEIAERAFSKMESALIGTDPHFELEFLSVYGGPDEDEEGDE